MQELFRGAEELETYAETLVRKIAPREHARVIALSGELGAGKTSFVQAAARSLGVMEHVSSPTFVLEKRYALPAGPFHTLVHIDAYRLKDASELRALRFEETLADPQTIIFIEWPERVEGLLPADTLLLSLTLLPEHGRSLSYDEKRI